MNDHFKYQKLLMVCTFPPRECGIATFSQDLSDAISRVFGATLPVEVCALENDHSDRRKYDKRVSYVLRTHNAEEYRTIAELINERKDIGMICIQHEFGLFGGEYGEMLISFMLALNKPITTVFHTVLPKPNEKLEKVVRAIADLSEKIIVQTVRSGSILNQEYGIDDRIIRVIPHGTFVSLWKDKTKLKEKYGYKNNIVLATFGLISENKNLETVLYALPEIVKAHPEVKYLILGKTHPEILRKEGERYRSGLLDLVHELGLDGNVVFENRFLQTSELLDYLNLSDIYLFSSKDPHQAVSGTFVYASSAGCPVISTPIPHAVEVIDKNSGVLLDHFEMPEEFRKAISDLIKDPEKRTSMGKNAFSGMRATCWENAAIAYAAVFGEITGSAEDLVFRLPPLSDAHLREMTTDTGMLQFSEFCKPDPAFGYTLDDNARALIAVLMKGEFSGETEIGEGERTYLSYFGRVQRADGWFFNYLDFDKKITIQNGEVNLEDANGRAMWALGYLFYCKKRIPETWLHEAEKYWNKAVENISKISSPRAMGFVIKGLFYRFLATGETQCISQAENFANKLLNHYHLSSDPDWEWYEDYLTYANSILPEAMMYAYLLTRDRKFLKIAEVTFDFLLSHYFMKGKMCVISNDGWFHRQKTRNLYGEQPIEVAYTILTLSLFSDVTGRSKYHEQLIVAFSWFLGNNHLGQIMYNPLNGAAYDGLEKDHINYNQGAESSLCYFMARLVAGKYTGEPAIQRQRGTGDFEHPASGLKIPRGGNSLLSFPRRRKKHEGSRL